MMYNNVVALMVVGRFAVLVDVESFFFHPLVHAYAYQFVCHLNRMNVITALNAMETSVAAVCTQS